ncbi:MAG: UbiX family flavin prenyltransferase [Deltaproteobacteria bacterium]|nr:UbiX family flavin prenyltransferase [Deltaproteobacteria bacterium]
MKRKIIVGISGASGALYGLRLLEALKKQASIEIFLTISRTGKLLLQDEIAAGALDQAIALADHYYEAQELWAPIASGSFYTDGMIIAPCSAKTLAAIAHGFGDTLLSRAADVVLKERRRLVLLFRETPLHLTHIDNMAQVTRMGGVILPPVPAFYHKPASIDDIINQSIGKALDLFSIEHALYRRWGSPTG